MNLTADNYFSAEANQQYMSVSQFKNFQKCESAALAEIKGEFSANGFENNLKHIRGVVSMARSGNDYNSASSQFFICHESSVSVKNLDRKYASFGYVVSGMDVVDAIAGVATNSSDKPLVDVVIEKACFVTVAP